MHGSGCVGRKLLIKVTNHCLAGCTHCMESSTVAGTHMPKDVFLQTLDFTIQTEMPAWKIGCPPLALLSGGECTEHPDIVWMVEQVFAKGLIPILITNGQWLADPELRAALLRPEWKLLQAQVTHDPRYYPGAPPPRINDPRLLYDKVPGQLMPLGRALNGKMLAGAEHPGWKTYPSSFNLRSIGRSFQSFSQAVCHLRLRAAAGKFGHCSPSVDSNGIVRAGETRECWPLGTVSSTEEELTRALVSMGSCNRCGLESNLTTLQKNAIFPSSAPPAAR